MNLAALRARPIPKVSEAMSIKPVELDRAGSIAALLELLLRERNSFLVTSHQRPDGDAIGSALGMMHLLEAMGKQVTVAFADPIPTPFHCLAGVERIVASLPHELARRGHPAGVRPPGAQRLQVPAELQAHGRGPDHQH
jgi:hypothetical protein